jgi:2-polyprenyl-6-methoxyphenol hydroxylase-like FAD-dependent oxidoreductase
MNQAVNNGAVDYDVLVVGAGPTGLMLANQLARRGARVLIVDRHSGPAQQTRALGVQARTLEIYAKLGVVDRALELGKIGTGANLWSEGRRIGHVSLGEAGKVVTPYPYIFILGQDDNERIMGDRLHDWNLAVRWSTELLALDQQADRVNATLRHADGTTGVVAVSWVDMVPDEVNVYLWKSGFHLFFPMRGRDHWRIVGIVPAALRSKDDLNFDAVIPSVKGEAGGALAFKSCSWFSTYRIQHRCASRFRERRCFLLGDAAHIHSPVGAQGMNTGLQDAYNLGWKLALVVGGKADTGLLDSYEAERLPVAQRLLATTDRAFKLIVSDSRFAGLLRTKVMARIAAFAMKRDWVQRIAFRTISQTGIEYRKSRLSDTHGTLPAHAPQAGDRFPWLKLTLAAGSPATDLITELDDTRFHLLLFGQQGAGRLSDFGNGVLQVHVVPDDPENAAVLDRANIALPSFYLLRPDGHVGLCGSLLEASAVAQYASTRLRLSSTR